jgi:hypothetical protein
MTSNSDNESESSLPTLPPSLHFRSSPPFAADIAASIESMDNGPQFKSEPPAPQVDPASKPAFTHAHSDETERPPSAQQIHDDEEKHVEEVVEDEDEDDGMELDLDPAEGIADFDWDALHERYHQAMDACHDQESDLSQEWTSLMNVRH